MDSSPITHKSPSPPPPLQEKTKIKKAYFQSSWLRIFFQNFRAKLERQHTIMQLFTHYLSYELREKLSCTVVVMSLQVGYNWFGRFGWFGWFASNHSTRLACCFFPSFAALSFREIRIFWLMLAVVRSDVRQLSTSYNWSQSKSNFSANPIFIFWHKWQKRIIENFIEL